MNLKNYKKTVDVSLEDLQKRDNILSGTNDRKQQNRMSCYEIMLHRLCNEKCYFCSQDHSSRYKAERPKDIEIYKRILFWIKNWYWMLGFTWWEPLIHQNIINYIKFWKKAGFNYIRIQTNWVMLWEPWNVKKYVDAWVTTFKLSIHHYKDEIHDYLVWVKWALQKCKYGIKELKKLWTRVWINIVITKQNYKDLPDILLYYLNLWITSFVIIFPLYENSMKNESNNVGIKFTDVIEYIIKSIQIFDKLGLERPLILNFPLCLLKWYETAIIQIFNWTAVFNLDWTKTKIDDNKAYGKKRVKICKNCEHNKICFWIDEEYLKKWWENEFLIETPKRDLKYNFDNLNLKEYFTEDELCFFELLEKKDQLTIEDILELKDNIQICQDCNSMNKIISTWEVLIKKWYVKKQMVKGKIVYNKIKFK